MAFKIRNQNPVIGDTVRLPLNVYNSNAPASVFAINQVEIFLLDPAVATPTNPYGRVLVETIPGASVVNPAIGEYYIDLFLDPGTYTQDGRYIDDWQVVFENGDPACQIENLFRIYPDLWYTTPLPVVYDFSFAFQPNRMRCGEIKPICIEITPNVPRATDLENYYLDLAIVGQLNVSIAEHCNPCNMCYENLIVDAEPTTIEDSNRAFYRIDTNDFDCGLYDIWFTLEFGGNTYVSPRSQFLIYG